MSGAEKKEKLEESEVKLIETGDGWKVVVEKQGSVVEEDKFLYASFDGDAIATKEEALMEFQDRVNEYS